MSSRRCKVPRPLPSHACAQWRYLKSHGAEYFQQQPILFETVTASTISNQLLKDGLWLETDGATEKHIQIFEGNRLYVR